MSIDFELKNLNDQKASFLVDTIKQQEPIIHEQNWKPLAADVKNIMSAKINDSIQINDFPLDAIETNETKLDDYLILKRYQIFADSAHIYQVKKSGTTAIEFPALLTFISAGNGIGLMINPKTGDASGYYNRQSVSLEIKGNIHTSLKVSLIQENTQNTNVLKQCSMKMEYQPGNPLADIKNTMTSMRNNKVSNNVSGSPTYQAIVAVDTNNEWMLGKGNNTTTAMNFITNLFVNMNVFYERDFSTRLLIGDVFLRTSPDPFPTQSAINTELSDFGSYWLNNNDTLNRNFALLLSGQNIPINSFSGIAWLNQYCQKGFLNGGVGPDIVGSYSVNRIGTNLSVGFVSQFVGHELGHNFGSPHTHCYSPEVDQCYNAETGCYSGAVSCPIGTGKGTIMSYCHFNAPNGANCGTSNETFHPTVISFINSKIVNNSPSCIAPFSTDSIFTNGFE